MNTFSNNLKRLRGAKDWTQEQVAAMLGVSPQAVSRWECATTMPDVSLLPKIAETYCVTIDDLFRENTAVYDNYAQRLLGVFEASHKPEDFVRADQEFRKLQKSGGCTLKDFRLWGILHQDMLHYCIQRAGELYGRVLEQGPEADPQTYWSTKRQMGFFLYEIGRNRENIEEFLPLVEQGSGDVNHWLCLLQAYSFEEDHRAAWDILQKAMEKFPENASLYIYGGDICRDMGRFEEAFAHWNRALELEPEWLDAAWSMGFCYEQLGDYKKAYEVWCRIAEEMESRGYESEVLYPRQLANHCRGKME